VCPGRGEKPFAAAAIGGAFGAFINKVAPII